MIRGGLIGFARRCIKVGLIEKFMYFQLGISHASNINAFTLEDNAKFRTYYSGKLKKLLGHKVNEKTRNTIINCLEQLKDGCVDDEYLKKYHFLLNVFATMECSTFKLERWKTLESFFLGNGMFQLALHCRQKSQEHLLKRPHYCSANLKRAIVYLEKRNLDAAKQEIQKIKNRKRTLLYSQIDIYALRTYFNLLCNDEYEKYELPFWNEEDTITNEFYKALCGRDVVIIGPAAENGELLLPDTNPIIVRPNDRGEVDSKQTFKIPETDIVYYSGRSTSDWLKRDNHIDVLKKFKFTVIKYYANLSGDAPIRKALPMDSILSTGTLNMLPLMILDLSMTKLSRLYVCRNNLFLSKNPYRLDYQEGEFVHRSNASMWSSFSIHNMFSQFILLQNLYQAGRFIPDAELKHVLELTVDDYARQMEQIYVFNGEII